MSSKEDEKLSVDVLSYITKQQDNEIAELKSIAKEAMDATSRVQNSLDEVLDNQKEFKSNQKVVNKRISAMEWKVKHHSETMDAIVKEQAELTSSLTTIKDTITQIKWIGYGALGMYGLQVIGVQDFLKSLI